MEPKYAAIVSKVQLRQDISSDLKELCKEGYGVLLCFLVLHHPQVTHSKNLQNLVHNLAVYNQHEALACAISLLKNMKVDELWRGETVEAQEGNILNSEDSERTRKYLAWLGGSLKGKRESENVLSRLYAAENPKLLIKEMLDIPDLKQRTALHLAVWNGYVEVVDVLLSNNVHVDAREVNGHTPLYYACYKKHELIVKSLLQHGAHLALPSSMHNPISQACVLAASGQDAGRSITPHSDYSELGIVKMLIGADPECIPQHTGHWTISEMATIEEWLARQKSVCHECDHHRSQLCAHPLGSEHFDATMRGLLLHLSTKHYPTSASPSGIMPRWVLAVISNKFMINIKDPIGNTPLMLAVSNKRRTCMRLLMEMGCHVNDQNRDTDAAIHIAVNTGNVHLVRDLLSIGTKPLEWETNGDMADGREFAELAASGDYNFASVKICGNMEGDGKMRPADLAHHNEDEVMFKVLTEEFPQTMSIEVPDRYKCTICTNTLLLPSRLACGHLFCLYCVSRMLGTQQRQNGPENGPMLICPYRCETKTIFSPQVDEEFENEMLTKVATDYTRRKQVFYKTRALELLYELCKAHELPLQKPHNKTIEVVIKDRRYHLSLVKDELHVVSLILPNLQVHTLPPNKQIQLYEFILEGNQLGRQVSGGTVNITWSNHLAMHLFISLELVRNTALCEIVTSMSNCLEGYQAHVEALLSDKPRDTLPPIRSEAPSSSLLSEVKGNSLKAKKMIDTLQKVLQRKRYIRGTVYFDGTKNYHMKVRGVCITLTYEAEVDMLYIYAPVWNLIPVDPKQKLKLYNAMLRNPHKGLPGRGVGLDSYGQYLMLHAIIHVGCVPHTALIHCFNDFVESMNLISRNIQELLCTKGNDLWEEEVQAVICHKTLQHDHIYNLMMPFIRSTNKKVLLALQTKELLAFKGFILWLGAGGVPSSLHIVKCVFETFVILAKRGKLKNIYLYISGQAGRFVYEGKAEQFLLLDDQSRLPFPVVHEFLQTISTTKFEQRSHASKATLINKSTLTFLDGSASYTSAL